MFLQVRGQPGTRRKPPGRLRRGSPAPGSPGPVIAALTALALGLRLFLLSRPGYLTGVTEYDDGVYLGGAVRLLSGAVPYHDYAFVQPPGILLLMTPAAALGKVTGVTGAMAAARLLTAAASAGCVPLAAALVRHRGRLATAVTGGLLALYPADISAAHTLLLEPWLNLLLLSGACLAFEHGPGRAGRLAAPRRLLWAGAAFGLAGAVKYWAALPALALIVLCLTTGSGRWRRAACFACGTAAAWVAAVAPFAAPWPGLFLRSTVLDQLTRTGAAVPQPLRLASLTGLNLLLSKAGQLTVTAAGSLFARGDVTAAATWATGWLPVLLALAGAAALLAGYAAGGVPPLGWYVLAVLCGTLAAVLGYSAFFYHYGDFPAPWLALSAGFAAPGLRARLPRLPGGRAALAGAGAAAVLLTATLQGWELSGLHAPAVRADAALIPPDRCVVTDEISLVIAAGRFTAGRDGCPDVLDSLAVTLVAGGGVSVQGGAARLPAVVTDWRKTLARGRYVWLSGSAGNRIPWTPGLRGWFARSFRLVSPPRGQHGEGRLYVRR